MPDELIACPMLDALIPLPAYGTPYDIELLRLRVWDIGTPPPYEGATPIGIEVAYPEPGGIGGIFIPIGWPYADAELMATPPGWYDDP